MVGQRVRMALSEALSEREEYLREWLRKVCETLEKSTEYDNPHTVEVCKPARIRVIRR